MKKKMVIVLTDTLRATFEIEEEEIGKYLRSHFFKIKNDNQTYIINTEKIKYIFYE